MNDKRITVFKNGETTNGKVLFVPATLDELFSQLFLLFKIKPRRLYNKHGGQITNIDLIRDDDVLYIAEDTDFIAPERALAILSKLEIKEDEQQPNQDWVTLNVGGTIFTTSKITLMSDPNSMLARMFAESDDAGYLYTPSGRDSNGAYLIDRNPKYFEPILNYLRNGKLIYDAHINPEGILEEARFFAMQSLIPQLEQIVQEKQTTLDDVALCRRDIIHASIRSTISAELRFQGVNLAGADLSKLDLRNINFKYANLRGCKLKSSNLSWCCLERADLSHTVLDGAQLLGVKSLCANFEGAVMRNCNFEDPGGSRANMEGVNLKEADLECSQMGGINLRVATLKNANLKNCDLRGAVLAGADLENCDLSGSDLHEANLRGANLKGAAFELMLTPLHMSQTIR